ncbi:hypothetical protein C8R44DRAFT_789966 [Mycena epipterygia]|nr:hypothetical protein C8R44DRAFT_789966 [Mycena epipterygia]
MQLLCLFRMRVSLSPFSLSPMSQPQSRESAFELIGTTLLNIFCNPCLAVFMGVQDVIRRRRRYKTDLRPRRNPPALPKGRIDVRQRPLVEQLPNCLIFQLPLELRHCIYEAALGGPRLINLRLDPSPLNRRRSVVKSTIKWEDTNHTWVRADAFPTGFLFSCRQVYLETLPMLHQRNTFSLAVGDLETIVHSALGRYCLPNIHRLYLHSTYVHIWNARTWAGVLPLLQQMHLEYLAFEIEMEPEGAFLDGPWARTALCIRNLREFELFFISTYPSANPLRRKIITEGLRQLMIGPGADERYAVFLEERKGAEERTRSRQ